MARSDFLHPYNPGDALRFNAPTSVNFDAARRGDEFALYDEYFPMTKVMLAANGLPGSTYAFFLNFASNEGAAITTRRTWSDGNDAIFGDLGNDWIVGGTGKDQVFGGWGNDLMNMDDDQSTGGGLNTTPDTHASYEDRAYGGAGMDVLIANTGGDRLIDWVGEFNSYLVPFAPFGLGTVSRTLQPQLAEFLYALSASLGADPTRAADTGADPARNGEPEGELGAVRQQDFAWQDQTGGPIDPQAGNMPGGKRDVLRSADFNTTAALDGFAVDSGTFEASGGTLQVGATSLHGDAAAVYNIPDYLPVYFEVQASISAIKPTAGWNANAYIIFDYQDPTHFKFAGIDVSINKLVMGHRDGSGWVVDEQTPFQAKADTFYNMLLSVNGLTATLIVDNVAVFTHTYAARVVDGYTYGLNYGFVGFGSDNARGSFDNIAVNVLPPGVTYDRTEDFDDGAAQQFTGMQAGSFTVNAGRYDGVATAGGTSIDAIDLGLGHGLESGSHLELAATVRATAIGGIFFDALRHGRLQVRRARHRRPAGRDRPRHPGRRRDRCLRREDARGGHGIRRVTDPARLDGEHLGRRDARDQHELQRGRRRRRLRCSHPERLRELRHVPHAHERRRIRRLAALGDDRRHGRERGFERNLQPRPHAQPLGTGDGRDERRLDDGGRNRERGLRLHRRVWHRDLHARKRRSRRSRSRSSGTERSSRTRPSRVVLSNPVGRHVRRQRRRDHACERRRALVGDGLGGRNRRNRIRAGTGPGRLHGHPQRARPPRP